MPKTSASELAARKKRARLKDEHRRQIEAQLAERQDWSAAELEDGFGLLLAPKFPPAQQFILDRMKGVNGDKMYDTMHRAMVDLLRGDIPLDKTSRQWIADMLWRLAFPNPAKEARRNKQIEAAVADELKRIHQERGATALEAEHLVAKDLGLKTVDALQKRRQRAKRAK